MGRLLADPTLGRAWVIRSGGRPAGYVVLTFAYSIEFGGRMAVVDELYVAPPHRRRGIGRLALQYAAEQAAALGVRGLVLEVSPANAGARRLYEAAGFVERTYRVMTRMIT
jgi:ribosomal protein S18 acetylase RimI-like enzyme